MKTFKNIKINLLMVLAAIAMIVMSSCSEKSPVPPTTPTPSEHLVINSNKKVAEVPTAHQMVVNVSSDADFKYVIKDGDDWITPKNAEKTHAKGDSVKITFDLKENKLGADRHAILLFAPANNNNFTDTVHVTQYSFNHLIFNSSKKVTEAMGSHKMVVNISSYADFKFAVKDGADWITSAEKTHAKGDKIDITFDLKANQSGSDRSAELLFATANNKDFTDTVYVTQTCIITVKTPGTLAQEIKNQGLDAMKLTAITVAGTLNGSDVLTLREMAGYGKDKKTDGQLTNLDISKVKFIKDPTIYFIDPKIAPKGASINSSDSVPSFMLAFCSSFKTINLPTTSVIATGRAVFYGCSSITSIIIPENITILGSSSFSGCSKLTDVKLPSKLKKIDHMAFRDCTALKSIALPESVEELGQAVFVNCSSLKDVNIPNEITKISDALFDQCKGLENVSIPEKVTSIGDFVFANCKSLKSINIPEKVTSIGVSAFMYCGALSEINIPEKVTSMGSQCFGGCLKLTDIHLPAGLKLIGQQCFKGCTDLTKVTIDVTNLSGLTVDKDAFDKRENSFLFVPKGSVADYKKEGSPFLPYFDLKNIQEQK